MSSYNIFGIVNHFRIAEKTDPVHLLHHVLTSGFNIGMLFWELPEMLAFINLGLFPGIAYNFYCVYKQWDGHQQEIADRLFVLNGILWFVFRVVAQGCFVFLTISLELSNVNPHTYPYRIFIFVGLAIFSLFAGFWMYQITHILIAKHGKHSVTT